MTEFGIGVVIVVAVIAAYIGFVVGVLIEQWYVEGDDDGGTDFTVPDYPPDDLLQIGGMMPRD